MFYDVLDWKEGFVEEKILIFYGCKNWTFPKDLTDDFAQKIILRVWLKKVMKSVVNF